MRLLALSLLVLPAVLAGNTGSIGISSPLLLWSNRGAAGQGKHISYQVLTDMEQVASELVLGALGKGPEHSQVRMSGLVGSLEKPRSVVVFIGSQLDAADMRGHSEAVQSLGTVLDAASSSLVIPYSTSQGGVSVRETVCSNLDKAQISHKAVGCSAPSAELKADVAAALAESRVVLVCASVQDAEDGLAAEIEQLRAVQAAVEETGVAHVMLYASQGAADAAAEPAGGKRRSLLATYTGFGPYTVCGPLCQTQVRWLEGMLAVLFLALASCAGLVCLYVLDTPTRFEAPPKDGAQQ
ncbi:hypothetical protein GPECTOR_5g296 [Gonium pectorale]|uniref:Protein BIG1 n=1 Tax=Gonium pectorale TaxID=33097 RepID=A0A150GWZ4_GONPE|nr:hypothetical protein GPECTOR_5g296 [Gonium pectorale]|eukprot:KXZ54202.1 hypothetical protein GPECTOR_5g296 [Gonium pectorale]